MGHRGHPARFEEITADFLYLRLHDAKELYSSGYDREALDLWAGRIARWAATGPPVQNRRSRDVRVYFDNDAKVRAPADARALAARLGVNPSAAPAPGPARAANLGLCDNCNFSDFPSGAITTIFPAENFVLLHSL